MVCSHAIVTLCVNTATFTLGHFVDRVLKKHMAFNSPSIMAGDFMYEEGDDLDADEVAEHAAHLPTALSALPGGGITHTSQVSVTDQTQEMTVTLVVSHQVRIHWPIAIFGLVVRSHHELHQGLRGIFNFIASRNQKYLRAKTTVVRPFWCIPK